MNIQDDCKHVPINALQEDFYQCWGSFDGVNDGLDSPCSMVVEAHRGHELVEGVQEVLQLSRRAHLNDLLTEVIAKVVHHQLMEESLSLNQKP